MSTKEHEQEANFDAPESASVDSFIKELEEKEKSLDISSDLVIEVDESDVDHNSISAELFSTSERITLDEFNPEMKASSENSVNNDPTGAVSSISKNEIDKLKADVARLAEEKRELAETLVRRQQDFDNYRSRTEREKKETFRGFVITIANEMLPVLDNLNRALDSFSDKEKEGENPDIDTLLDGIVLVNQQLNDVISNMGINAIAAVGQPFDPHFHEAVETVDTDEFPPETVVSEILKGYRVDDKVIRASMVTVSAQKR